MILKDIFRMKERYTLKGISFDKEHESQEVFYIGKIQGDHQKNYQHFTCHMPENNNIIIVALREDAIITDGKFIEQILSANGEMVTYKIDAYTQSDNEMWRELSAFLEGTK